MTEEEENNNNNNNDNDNDNDIRPITLSPYDIWDTTYTACSVEFCPIKEYENILVCGTYQLNEETRVRSGELTLHRVIVDNSNDYHNNKEKQIEDTLPLPLPPSPTTITTTTRQQPLPSSSSSSSSPPPPPSLPLRFEIDGQGEKKIKNYYPYSKSMAGGILDSKWSYQTYQEFGNNNPLLGCVMANGQISIQNVVDCSENENENENENKNVSQLYCLEEVASSDPQDDRLFLSLDWGNRLDSSNKKIIISDSLGELSLFQINDDTGDLDNIIQWKAHNLYGCPIEAWICGFNYWCPTTILSGADDCLFKIWDTRSPIISKRPFFQSEEHTMGVCSIHWNPHHEHVFATGSYDGEARVWDDRNLSNGPMSKIPVDGGVWRLKWHPNPLLSNHLLAACMHGGVRKIEVTSLSSSVTNSITGCSSTNNDNNSLETLEVIGRYENHKSMAYGIDWCHKTDMFYSKDELGEYGEEMIRKRNELIASCSFYDHVLHLWD